MDGAEPSPRTPFCVQRDFEFSRLERQLLALAYEHLLPMLPAPQRANDTPRATKRNAVQAASPLTTGAGS
jgi:hypothetical protein